MRWLSALLFAVLPTVALAANGVLIERIPAGATPEVAMAVVKQALINRHWTVADVQPASVSATIRHAIIDVDLRISLKGRSLTYEGSAKRLYPRGNPAQSQGVSSGPAALPIKWVNNLKRDISLALATIPDRATAAAGE